MQEMSDNSHLNTVSLHSSKKSNPLPTRFEPLIPKKRGRPPKRRRGGAAKAPEPVSNRVEMPKSTS